MQKTRDTLITIAVVAGMLMIAVGIAMPLLTMNAHGIAFKYIYTAGAIVLLLARLYTDHKEEPLRVRRLHRMEVWSALMYCAAAFALYYDQPALNNAIALTLAGAVIQAYITIMLPIEQRKHGK